MTAVGPRHGQLRRINRTYWEALNGYEPGGKMADVIHGRPLTSNPRHVY